MNLLLWIIAGLLAVVLLTGGAALVAQPKEKLAAGGFGFVEDFSAAGVKAIGAVKILAAAGLILPALFGIAPVLVPLAAAGVVLLMAGAVIVHLRRHETKSIAAPVILLALAVVVAWSRFGPQAFTS